MSSFDTIKGEAIQFVKENKEFFDRFNQEIDGLSLGNYIDLYLGSKGISHLNTGEEFDKDYDKALESFSNQKNQFEEAESLIIKCLDFLIWIKKQQDTHQVEIVNRKRLHKHALEFPNTINRIYLNNQLDKKDKIEVLLFYYCSLQEIFKNVIQEELLLKIWKLDKPDACDLRKKHIQLGDFLNIIEKYESNKGIQTGIRDIFDVELRNKILHADFVVEQNKIIYGNKEISKQDIFKKITKIGIVLQFLVLFYLRLFQENLQ